MGIPKGKILIIDTISKQTLNGMKFDVNLKKSVLGDTSRGLPTETKFMAL